MSAVPPRRSHPAEERLCPRLHCIESRRHGGCADAHGPGRHAHPNAPVLGDAMNDLDGQSGNGSDKPGPDDATRQGLSTHGLSATAPADTATAPAALGPPESDAARYASCLGQQDAPQPIRNEARDDGSPEGRKPRAHAHAESNAPTGRSLRVTTPDEAPDLTPGAARILLRILLHAAGQQGLAPPDSADRHEQ